MKPIFHLAFNVRNLHEARNFYVGALGCVEGRSTDTWVDFDFFGHQISLHLGEPFQSAPTGQVGEHTVPMPHFGIILGTEQWQILAQKLKDLGQSFVIEPHCRFQGEPGEQWTMFLLDPFGNPIEIKGFANEQAVFSH